MTQSIRKEAKTLLLPPAQLPTPSTEITRSGRPTLSGHTFFGSQETAATKRRTVAGRRLPSLETSPALHGEKARQFISRQTEARERRLRDR